MKTRHLLVTGLCLALIPGRSLGQSDVTETYLTNPSFEADAGNCTGSSANKVTNGNDGLRGWNITPQGWTVKNPPTALLITADCFTDNNFGKTPMADGGYAYYQRVGWSDTSSQLSQTSRAALPAGTYRLTFDTKAIGVNGGTSTSASVKVTAADGTVLDNISFGCQAGAPGIMPSLPWSTHTLVFTINEPTSITLQAEMTWKSGGSCMAYDNFRLTQYPEGYEFPKEPDITGDREDTVSSPTEGVITSEFTGEAAMMDDLLQMLTDNLTYAKSIWFDCAAPNSQGEACGFFKGNSAGNSNEDGVRTNADFSMICAFLHRYARGKTTLPAGITWSEVKDMAMKSLVFGYSTHKANKLKVTSDQKYWGSVSTSDAVWESSLWTMSLAYASYFLADELTKPQQTYIYNMIKTECNYELQRNIPTGYIGDTKSEENGWEADVLACALGLYPDDELAPKWFDRLRSFAINSYSHADDALNTTVIDPEYDNRTVADLFLGKNLYDDYTLQNHNFFHTSYQNVVMQELGEACLALRLFQGETPRWHTNALMHNNQKVMDEVLCWLALADGELAMPNGNDWSMFLYDQITSYSTAACFLRDPNALMLENLAYKYIKARQSTTNDGSWLLNSDIGPRRMGVEGHRVMMTYLMHCAASTADLTPTRWEDFRRQHAAARLFPAQNIVRSSSADRFSVFSWSPGSSSYTGYIAANRADNNKIIVPYKANNTGNILGWYTVSGKGTNASPEINGIYRMMGDSYAMNGRLSTNDNVLTNSFALYATPGNAFIYVDYVKGKSSGTITREQGGLMAISTDPLTKIRRTLYYAGGRCQSDGNNLFEFEGQWVNIDNAVGIVVPDKDNRMAFGDRTLTNSIHTAKIYPSYSTQPRTFKSGDVVDKRHLIYYSNVDSATTARLCAASRPLTDLLPEGWNGILCADPNQVHYILVSNFDGETACSLKDICIEGLGAPVFGTPTTIKDNKSATDLRCDADHSIAQVLRIFVEGSDLTACQVKSDSLSAYLYNGGDVLQKAVVRIVTDNGTVEGDISLGAGSCVKVGTDKGSLVYEETVTGGDEEGFVDITARFLGNPGFEEDRTYGTTGNATLGGTSFSPCYLNNVSPVDNQWAQVLPVQKWTPENTMRGGSPYAIRYSMPYSRTMYCVSPASIGNSASIMAAPAQFEDCGARCLTFMNSWDNGGNRITQRINLPKGEYRLTFAARYTCPNEMRHTRDRISAVDNDNYSLCGIVINNEERYAYPSTPDNWERIVLPFSLEEETEVTVSMGLRTTANVGAANNTRLYLDNVTLLSKEEIPDDVYQLQTLHDITPVCVYTPGGVCLRRNIKACEATDNLPGGIYIVGNRTVCVQ